MWQRFETILNVREVVQWLSETWITWWAASSTGTAPRMIFNPSSIKQEFAADAATRVRKPNQLPEEFPSMLDEESSTDSDTLPFPDLPRTAEERITATEPPRLKDLPNLPYDVLIFQTISLRLELGSAIGDSNSCFQIFDCFGDMCGEVIPDFPTDSASSSPEHDGMEARTDQNPATASPFHEFIVIAERPYELSYKEPAHAVVDDFATYTKADMYWVMMIEYLEEKGAYERRGLGYVLKMTLGESFPPGAEWKEIVLA